MHQSPRIRRLHSDLAALERLRSESSVFRFTATGDPPQHYQHQFFRVEVCGGDRGKVKALDQHRVEIKLGASYPRTMPEIRWLTPIFHPNISEIGMVCLGGYGTHWVPSVQLDDLCVMLWDMARYHNYDIRSPYNRESALWVAGQTTFRFPTDARPLRDLRAVAGARRFASRAHRDRDPARNDSRANRSSRSTSRPSPRRLPASSSSSNATAADLDDAPPRGSGTTGYHGDHGTQVIPRRHGDGQSDRPLRRFGRERRRARAGTRRGRTSRPIGSHDDQDAAATTASVDRATPPLMVIKTT